MRRPAAQTIRKYLWVAAVAVRVVAVVVLVFGPWTDEPTELAGWDAERFQEIAERDGAGWVDQPIEYPPGSVVVFDAVAGSDVVDTNRAIVVLSAAVEAATVVLLWRSVAPSAAKAFLILGLPLVPMGLLRLDMLVTGLATAAAVALLAAATKHDDPAQTTGAGGESAVRVNGALGAASFAFLVMAGAMVKIWPALLVAAALSGKRWQAAAAAVGVCAVAGLGWLAIVGAGLDPVDQVLSLRGATGWHVESVPGALIALFGDADPRLELNAFRIGTLDRSLVTVGRIVAVGLIGSLVVAGARTGRKSAPHRNLALVMLGSAAALIVTAPLLSPQFLLWLTPWGALLVNADSDHQNTSGRSPLDGDQPVLWLLGIAVVMTGFTLTVFGPAGVAGPVPAALLTVRNLALVLLPAACLLRLR